MGAREVRWAKGDPVRAEDDAFVYGKGNEIHRLGTGFYVHQRMVSAVKRVEFASDRKSHIVPRCSRCDITASSF